VYTTTRLHYLPTRLANNISSCGSNGYRGDDGRCYYYGGYYNSAWYWWGRWVFAGLAILFIILVFAALLYVPFPTLAYTHHRRSSRKSKLTTLLSPNSRNSRRRRKQGLQPLYGTGWMAPAPPPYYPPPPQYSAQDQGQGHYAPQGGYKYGSGDGYYGGGNQEGIQLQQPASAYHRGPDQEYAPPPGPPPNAAK
jgi:hypothetical protein